MASADLTAVVVAAVGVAGTMGAPLLSQWSRRRELAEEGARAERQRQQDRDESNLQRKRDLYAALNSSARAYRTAAYDYILALKRGENADGSALESARGSYRDQYAQAQMVLPGRTLQVASEVNHCLSLGYKLVKQLPNPADSQDIWRQTETWFATPLAEAVWLLRHALREDLGVLDEFPDLPERVQQLRATRKHLTRQTEERQDPPQSGQA
ncbi:hypothetical protein [Streptomyces sp. NPDC053069]|uniref:hypothetical protein n=1 Tax=Streptomyces sp. NPDC053069 TaxID=3365695 RepID=UPI0037D3B87F